MCHQVLLSFVGKHPWSPIFQLYAYIYLKVYKIYGFKRAHRKNEHHLNKKSFEDIKLVLSDLCAAFSLFDSRYSDVMSTAIRHRYRIEIPRTTENVFSPIVSALHLYGLL